MSFATLCLLLVHVFGTSQEQIDSDPTQHQALRFDLRLPAKICGDRP